MACTPVLRQTIFQLLHDSACLLDFDLSKKKTIQTVKEYYHYEDDLSPDIIQTISKFIYKVQEKWKTNNRTYRRIVSKNHDWLHSHLFSDELHTQLTSRVSGPGRPSTDWSFLSDRSKRRKVSELSSQNDTHKLMFAASQSAYGNNPDLRYVIKFLAASPSRTSKMRSMISNSNKSQETFTPDEALSLLIETDMTKHAYQTLRSSTKRKHIDLYPPYNDVREAKRKCYPANIQVSDHSAKVPLQDVLDHTSTRIIEQSQESVTEAVKGTQEGDDLKLTLVCKWGFDGASGHSAYKQTFSSPNIPMRVCFPPLLFPCS